MGHPILRRKAKPVDPKALQGAEFQDLVDSMYMTMLEYDGVGLAAPQVHQGLRVVVLHEDAGFTDPDGEALTALVNPEITPLTEDTASMWEGCLSVPGIRGKVSRPARVRVKGLDRHGRALDFELENFPAVVIQHECDHLDGILFVDRVADTRDLAFEKEFERWLLPSIEEQGEMVDEG
jgi:peptide deformylase